jgi:hypothetical protein
MKTRKQSARWMESRLRRLEFIKNPTKRQLMRADQLRKALNDLQP